MKILSLDLSMKRTGYSIFEDEQLVDYGFLVPDKYPNQHKERYPQRTTKVCRLMSIKVSELMNSKEFDIILIEEINPNLKAGVKSIKGLAMLHGMIGDRMSDIQLDNLKIITTSFWRNKLGIKKNGDWKQSSVDYCNNYFALDLSIDENDEADSLNMALSFILDNTPDF